MNREEQWLLEQKYGGQKTEGFLADVERLRAGEPLAYLLGHIPFLTVSISLDSRPLIPRTETEYWTEQAIHMIMEQHGERTVRILDLCAGSGCIGVAVLKALPNAVVDFIELDAHHHETIAKNCASNGIAHNRVRIFGGDLFAGLPCDETAQYEYILTNPPYIDPMHDRTDRSVRAYEPAAALYAEDGGYAYLSRTITTAPAHLTETGVLFVEHDPEQAPLLLKLGEQAGCTSETRLDQYGIKRFTVCTRGDGKKVQQ